MKNYIPKTKGDIQAVKNLSNLPFETVKADVPELLEWMQDMNWPVGRGISQYLTPHVNEIKEHLLDVLKTDDDVWKLWIMSSLVANSKVELDPELTSMIKRIADHPTRGEIVEGADQAAKEIIANKK